MPGASFGRSCRRRNFQNDLLLKFFPLAELLPAVLARRFVTGVATCRG